MLFQLSYSGAGSGFFEMLYQWGFIDAILPFLLIFIIIFAVLQKIGLFKDDDGKPDRKINGILGMIIGAMVVIPHVLRLYDPSADPVMIINQILPGASALLIAVLLVIILLGLAGGTIPNVMVWLVALVALAFMVFLIVSAIFPAFLPNWQFLQDPAMQAALVILIVMGLVVYFIIREPSDKGSLSKWLKDWMGPPQ